MALLISILLASPALVSSSWIFGGSGESCSQACAAAGLACSVKGLHEHNIESNSEREVAALVGSFNETCKSYNLNYGSNTDIPAYQKSNGECYVSDITRQLSAFNCDRASSVGKHRICWCHAAEEKESPECAQDESDDSAKISTTVIVWIIGGNILALGLVCMFCLLLHNICQSQPDESPQAPTANTTTIVLCPACQCQLERSHATGTTTYSRVGPKSTGFRSECSGSSHYSGGTVKFRDEVSEVSASQSQLGVVREATAEASATMSQHIPEEV